MTFARLTREIIIWSLTKMLYHLTSSTDHAVHRTNNAMMYTLYLFFSKQPVIFAFIAKKSAYIDIN